MPRPLFFAFFCIFIDFHVYQASVCEAQLTYRHFLLRSCPENACLYFFEPKSMPSKCYKALFTLPISPPSFAFYHIFINFHVHRAPVGKVRLPNWYHLLNFHSKNTAQHFSEPRSTRLKCYKALFTPPKPRFLTFSSIFTCTKSLYARKNYLLCNFWFIFV